MHVMRVHSIDARHEGFCLSCFLVLGESGPGDNTGPTGPPSSTNDDSGDGGTVQNTVATTVGFVVVLVILVMAVLMTVLLCIRHGMCSCPGKKPPPTNAQVTPASRMAGGGSNSRVNRSPLVSSSSMRSNHSRGGGPSPNTVFPHHHSHHHHYHHSHHHSHASSHSSPRRHNGHAGGTPVDRSGNHSGPSIGGSSGYSQHHHHMRSASMDPPLPTNISPYPGMPFPYQPCKSPMTAYGGGGLGFTIHPQIPRTPTSASITTLSSLSTAQNQRHTMSNGGIGGRERGSSVRGERAVEGRERGGSDRRATGDGQEGREVRVGVREGDDQRRGDSGSRGRAARKGKEERGKEGVDGGERETNRSSGDLTDIQRSPALQRQVESSGSVINSSPLQLYSTQV